MPMWPGMTRLYMLEAATPREQVPGGVEPDQATILRRLSIDGSAKSVRSAGNPPVLQRAPPAQGDSRRRRLRGGRVAPDPDRAGDVRTPRTAALDDHARDHAGAPRPSHLARAGLGLRD